MLADLGAEVIKVERPGQRRRHAPLGPAVARRRRATASPLISSAATAARNRPRSISPGPKARRWSASSREQADVVVENFKVGGLEKFGLDAASLRAANPRLVYASITGFGQDGPYADRAGYDYIIQGMGGLMSITGLPDGEPGGGPMRVGVAVVDLFTGLYTCVAILAALYAREKTGEGAHIDMALFDTQLAMLANQASNALVSGKDPPRQGNTHPNIVPYQPFEAADQPIIIAVGNDRQFARLAEICGHPEWASDERFASNGARVANRDGDGAAGRRCDPPQGRRPNGSASSKPPAFPPGPINRISQALADVQAQHRADGAHASPECRWSARRCGSTASARIPTCRRPRSASIRSRSSQALGLGGSRDRPR